MSGFPRETYAYARPPRRDEADPPLAESYLKSIAKLESLPRHQSGADKSWVEEAIRDWERHYRLAVRVR
jgi:hypothetical protein